MNLTKNFMWLAEKQTAYNNGCKGEHPGGGNPFFYMYIDTYILFVQLYVQTAKTIFEYLNVHSRRIPFFNQKSIKCLT